MTADGSGCNYLSFFVNNYLDLNCALSVSWLSF